MATDLPPQLAAIAADQDGAFTRAQALACGVSPDEYERAVSRRRWHRVRRGVCVPADIWHDAGDAARQRLGLRALALLASGPVVGSHDTAAAVLGLELWEPEYDWLHLTRPGHSARRESGAWHHKAALDSGETVTVAGLVVTNAVRTSLDVARRTDFEHGVVAVDSALRLSQVPLEQVRHSHFRCTDWPGARAAGRAVSLADGRSGSVGESRLRAQLIIAGLPEPLTQVSVYDEQRHLVAIVDFLLGEKVILEFDGKARYGLDGLTPTALGEQLWREKQREDALRRLGYELGRVIWADLYRLERIVTRVRAGMGRAALSPPVRGTYAVEPLRERLAS